MPLAHITRRDFLRDHQGRSLSEFLDAPDLPFDTLLDFFNCRNHQQQMEHSETINNKSPAAGVVRDLESIPAVQAYLSASDPQRKKRFGRSITILVRMIMERLGWQVVSKKVAKRGQT